MTTLSDSCRRCLCRTVWNNRDGNSIVAYTLASTREDARRRFHQLIPFFSDEPEDELVLYQLQSYRDLVDMGISDDEELRVFETGWTGAVVAEWADRPLFLTTDQTLIHRWAELQADLAAQKACDLIGRAGRRR